MRRALTIVVVLAAISAVSWLAYQELGSARAAPAPDYEVVPVERGDIAETVSATGTVLPEREAALSFKAAGSIAEVAVAVGDAVSAGDILARLDTADLDLAVRQAEIGVRTAQAQLRQLQEGPSNSDVASAQAALSSAQAAYQDLLQGANPDELAAARAQVEQARVSLDQAQQAYDQVKDLPNVGMTPQALQLQQATINFETAEAQFRVTSRGASEAQVAAAQAQIAQAQAALDKLMQGPSAEQVEISQAQLDQAELTLEQAQRQVEEAQLVAPWDGIVTAVNIVQGDLAQPGVPALMLTDVGRLHIDVQVDEVDITRIAEGQPVSIELDAVAGERMPGHVARVAPTATQDPTGIIAYQVRVAIDSTNPVLRPGMSATAAITSAERDNVLLIPNRSVQYDRSTGKSYVERLQEGTPQRVEVQLGLRDEQRSEVRTGLTADDQVVIRNVSSLERLQMTFGGGGGF